MKCGICGSYKNKFPICDECLKTGRDIGLIKLKFKSNGVE